MDQTKIDRINFLAKKQRSPQGLTPEEKSEQTRLRAEYIADFRRNLQSQLDSITVQEEDGSLHKLKRTKPGSDTPA